MAIQRNLRLVMKLIFKFLILILSFQSLTKADDVKDFEIEGISIGVSLLNYFSKENIMINTSKFVFKDTDKKFQAFFTDEPKKLKSYDLYDYVRITYLNDNEFIIHGISGMKDYEKKNINQCYELQEKIEIDFDNQFSNFEKEKNTFPYGIDSSGKSKVTAIYYFAEDGYAEIACYDLDENTNIASGIDVSISSNILKDWIQSLR